MLSFFPRGVLDEILNLNESVSEGFPSYFWMPVWVSIRKKTVPGCKIYTLLWVPGQKVPFLLGMKQVYISLGATLL